MYFVYDDFTECIILYGNEVVFEDLFIICCRHVTLLQSTVYNDCIIYVILLFTLQHNVYFNWHGCNNVH